MNQVPIYINEDHLLHSASSVDIEREEQLWTSTSEKLIIGWRDNAQSRSAIHGKKGKLNKFKYALFGVPSTLIPIIIAGTSEYIVEHPLMSNILLIIAGALSGIVSFFNFGAKSEKHYIAEVKLVEFVNEIDVVMSKPKRHRQAVDVYMQATLDKYNSILESAPDI